MNLSHCVFTSEPYEEFIEGKHIKHSMERCLEVPAPGKLFCMKHRDLETDLEGLFHMVRAMKFEKQKV